MRFIFAFVFTLLASNTWAVVSGCAPEGAYRLQNGCMPVVFVIRHAEDTASGPHALTPEGKTHAQLYPMLFQNYIWGDTRMVGIDKNPVCVCPIGKIISISDQGGGTTPPNPSPNPYYTIKPLSESLNIPITKDNGDNQYWSSFQWLDTAKKKLFDHRGNLAQYSVVIAWDKQGLNPMEEDYKKLVGWLNPPASQVPYSAFTPLLKAFPVKVPPPTSVASDPLRTNLWVYSNQDENGKFINLRFFQQGFYDQDCKSNETILPTINSKCIVLQQRDY